MSAVVSGRRSPRLQGCPCPTAVGPLRSPACPTYIVVRVLQKCFASAFDGHLTSFDGHLPDI